MPTLALRPSQIEDMVTATLNDFEYDNLVDISLKNPDYVIADSMHDKSRHKTTSGGIDHEWEIQVANNRNVRLSGLYDVDTTSQRQLLKRGKASLSMIRTNFEFDIFEKVFNSGDSEKIIDYVETKKHSMDNDFVEQVEEWGWQSPASSDMQPYPLLGFPFWLQKGSALAFNPYGGVDPTGWTGVGRGNVLTSAYSRWANATFGYKSVSRGDFIKKLRRASRKCGFKTPKMAGYKNLIKEGGSNFVYYSTSNLIEELEVFLEARNDNFKNDLDKYQGMTLYKGNPFVIVDYLDDNDATDPCYCVNWNTFNWLTPKNGFQTQSDLMTDANRSTVRIKHFYWWVQLICRDLRRNCVGHRM